MKRLDHTEWGSTFFKLAYVPLALRTCIRHVIVQSAFQVHILFKQFHHLPKILCMRMRFMSFLDAHMREYSFRVGTKNLTSAQNGPKWLKHGSKNGSFFTTHVVSCRHGVKMEKNRHIAILNRSTSKYLKVPRNVARSSGQFRSWSELSSLEQLERESLKHSNQYVVWDEMDGYWLSLNSLAIRSPQSGANKYVNYWNISGILDTLRQK